MSDRIVILTEIDSRDATVAQLRDRSFGSMRQVQLEALEHRLLEVSLEISTSRLILDLNSIEVFGAAFLGILLRVRKSLVEYERDLLLVRRDSEVMALAGLGQVIPIFASTIAALRSPVPRQPPSRGRAAWFTRTALVGR